MQSDNASKFGAFSDIGLDSVGGWRRSEKSYLFTLEDVPVKCEVKQDKKLNALYFQSDFGLWFGRKDLVIDFDTPFVKTGGKK